MRLLLRASVPLLLAALLILPAVGQTRDSGPWWPHPIWGPDDQAGGSNWITPEKIVSALSLVETGRVYELGHPYERSMPHVGERSYNLFIASFPTYGPPPGEPGIVYNDEFVAAELGQVGTQFDGPGHVGRRIRMADGTLTEVFYNGYTADEMRHPYGLLRLGVEHLNPYITRGLLIDVAGALGVDILPDGYEVGLDDVRRALDRQGIDEADIEPGDALFFNFGWWRHWPDPISITGNRPYLGADVVAWVIERRAAMVGSDASLDGPEPRVHAGLVLEQGIFNLELMTFESLLADNVHQFLFVFTPLRLVGATGSPGRPIAIR